MALAVRRVLPSEDLVYLADCGEAPYGDRPVEWIESRMAALVGMLEELPVKAIVVACNTATTVAIQALRAASRLPIVAIEPAIKPAARLTKARRVAVMATSRTIASKRTQELVELYGQGVSFHLQPCPGLADCVDQGLLHAPLTRQLLEGYVQQALASGADTLVLGCTHYPFLLPLIQELAGPHVRLIDPAMPVAEQLVRVLHACGLARRDVWCGSLSLYTSGNPKLAHSFLRSVLPQEIPAIVASLDTLDTLKH